MNGGWIFEEDQSKGLWHGATFKNDFCEDSFAMMIILVILLIEIMFLIIRLMILIMMMMIIVTFMLYL